MNYYAYIRVSTAKQGTSGVSLEQQRDAIERYATKRQLAISAWFEERQTAAKRGRREFEKMLAFLREGRARGIIIHKIDRSARNLKDWANLGELIDAGIEVHFANESLDLQSRGGRLSADIQAVVAADFIRNLREETRKGFYGRLKQGLYPRPAPLGYRDQGRGLAKTIDPRSGPLVRQAFELYTTGRFTLDTLADEMYRRGLRTKSGQKIRLNVWSSILNNPFYSGTIRIRKSGETFPGKHERLISPDIFAKVQSVLRGKYGPRKTLHDFRFRRLFSCAKCRYSLIGERQKGHVYYRCHTRTCPVTSVREETLEDAILGALSHLSMTAQERTLLAYEIETVGKHLVTDARQREETLRLRIKQLDTRLHRLTDAYVDGVIEKDLFENRKTALALERCNIEESLALPAPTPPQEADVLRRILELAFSASDSYKVLDGTERREFITIFTSNRAVDRKKVELSLNLPFSLIAERHKSGDGVPQRNQPRKEAELVERVLKWISVERKLAGRIANFVDQNTSFEGFGKTERIAA